LVNIYGKRFGLQGILHVFMNAINEGGRRTSGHFKGFYLELHNLHSISLPTIAALLNLESTVETKA